eukprot:TRINITY_DN4215_c0_g1_i4.p1 TRINITY_DN4215_c0_g1~~TRINITY_DN4215_c0_g1_i4.p1  ORF type:complete len:156 (+),score=22.88 TRINITY_DN4215_c0_g1_i4:315-782(+)
MKPKAVRVLDTQDLHFLRRAREQFATSNPECSIEDVSRMVVPNSDADFGRELSAIYRSDLTLLVSNYEEELLVKQYGVHPHKLALAPFFYDTPTKISTGRRYNFVMIGNCKHHPNKDAVCHTCTHARAHTHTHTHIHTHTHTQTHTHITNHNTRQ